MNPKIEKICGEMDKLQEKIADLQARWRKLESKKKELENAEIVATVRGVKATPAELEAFLQNMRGTAAHKLEETDHEKV